MSSFEINCIIVDYCHNFHTNDIKRFYSKTCLKWNTVIQICCDNDGFLLKKNPQCMQSYKCDIYTYLHQDNFCFFIYLQPLPSQMLQLQEKSRFFVVVVAFLIFPSFYILCSYSKHRNIFFCIHFSSDMPTPYTLPNTPTSHTNNLYSFHTYRYSYPK